jgi:D-sedoheptulose 7-phosphate isomerase
MIMQDTIRQTIERSILLKQSMLADAFLMQKIALAGARWVSCFREGGKVLFCGNGGSAADAQHLAAELSGRFYLNRPPLFAEALHVNTSYLTAVANDFGYDQVYARLVEGFGRPGDVLVALSTSGQSANIISALRQAKSVGVYTIGLTGRSGGDMAADCDLLLNVPSDDTPRIQEAHMLIGHILCEQVERELFA